jgi:transposase
MPARRITMRKIREVLRLVWSCGLGHRRAGLSCGIGKTTVSEYLRRAEQAGLHWIQVQEMDEEELERLLYPAVDFGQQPKRWMPEWSEIHMELRKKGVTLLLLWQEYHDQWPEGYGYSQFCHLYRKWRKRLNVSMRQHHRAGEKLFVDYAGPTVPIVDRKTGEVAQAQVFVAVLGASNYTYAEATWTQDLQDWTGSHERAFRFMGGVPEVVVPDNLLSGVTSPCRYDPDLNRTYNDLAVHYGVSVIPARVRRPKDKAKVETGVLVVERWILARLRNQTFFSLDDLNRAIRELLTDLNERPFKKLPGCRRSQFEALDAPALRPLPPEPFPFGEWRRRTVPPDYHVEIEGHAYSVPYTLVGKKVDVRFGAETVECFYRGRRIASHRRSREAGGCTTQKEHMPVSHRKYAEWTPDKAAEWAARSGPSVAAAVADLSSRKTHPFQTVRFCAGLQGLEKRYGADRLERACERALDIGGVSYRSIRSILQKGLDRLPPPEQDTAALPVIHGNIRGAEYYQAEARPC